MRFLRRLLAKRDGSRDTTATEWRPTMSVRSHVVPADFEPQFIAAGYQSNHFFPHRVHRLPKAGPDGAQLAEEMCGIGDADALWQIVLFAIPPVTDAFPRELFFDPDIVWHQQHFDQPGQIASIDLAVRGGTVFTMAHQSDLVQRISRRRDLKTRVERSFKGWHHVLLNSVVAFAADRGAHTVRVPTSALAMKHTDRKRHVRPELFERVYDRAVHHRFRAASAGAWWSIDVAANRRAVVEARPMVEERASGKTVCVCHDVERGLGHRDVAPTFAAWADAESPAALTRILDVERAASVRATYNVVGCMMADVRPAIERGGHCIAFHSFDHDRAHNQLDACRGVDYRIKGYRPPRSELTAELRNGRLTWRNFEWLATSASSLGFQAPRLTHRVVKIPILFDDFPLHTGKLMFDAWSRQAMDTIRRHEFVAFSLHDCYASHWLPSYERFLEDVKSLARLSTLDEVSNALYLAAGV